MYSVEIDDGPKEQIAHLPEEALLAFASLMDLLEWHPWSGDAYNRQRPDGNVRAHVFGPQQAGMVSYLILEDQRRVVVIDIKWIG